MAFKFFYFDVEHAIDVHDFIIENSGGASGTNKIALLESPLEHIKNDLYYPNIEDKVTHLVYSINKNHAFTDGNKRSSIVLGSYFLTLNGYNYLTDLFLHRMENITVWLAAGALDKDLLLEVVTSIVYEDDYSESLKLKIASAALLFAEQKNAGCE
jgi:death-on-curing protein